MMEECNFKSSVKHSRSFGCDLTPNQIACPGEKKLYSLSKLPERNRHILGYGSNEPVVDIPTLFGYMIVDEIKHMRIIAEIKDAF